MSPLKKVKRKVGYEAVAVPHTQLKRLCLDDHRRLDDRDDALAEARMLE